MSCLPHLLPKMTSMISSTFIDKLKIASKTARTLIMTATVKASDEASSHRRLVTFEVGDEARLSIKHLHLTVGCAPLRKFFRRSIGPIKALLYTSG